MRLLFCFLLLLVFPCLSVANYWHKLDLNRLSGKKGANEVTLYFNKHYSTSDTTVAFKALDALLLHARNKGKPHLEVAALGLKGGFFQGNFFDQYKKAGRYFEQAKQVAGRYGLTIEEARYQHKLGYVQCQAEEYAAGLKNLLSAEEAIQRIGAKNFPEYEHVLYDRAKIYLDFGYYGKAETFLQEALRLADSEKMQQCIYNAKGILYAEWGKNKESAESLEKMLALAEKNQDSLAVAAASINLGIIHLKRNLTAKARPLLERGYALGILLKDRQIQFVSLLASADLDVQEGFLDYADTSLAKQLRMFKEYNIKDLDYWQSYYDTKSNWNKKKGNFKEASLYQDSLVQINDSIFQMRQTSQLLNMETQLLAEQYAMEIRLVKEGERWQRTLRELVTVLAILLILFFFVWYYHAQKAHKRKQQHLEQEKQEAIERLKALKKRVRTNNRIIEELNQQKNRIELEAGKEAGRIPDQKLIDQLHQTVILTEEDWREFKQVFEKAHPKFLKKLCVLCPELTESELRVLALIKLNLSTGEMASMLAILPQSVRKTRQRLMKKLELNDPKMLPSFLERI